MPSHMQDPNAPKTNDPTQAPDATRVQPTPRPAPQPGAQPAGDPGGQPTGQRFQSDDRPSPYANEPQEIEIPERKGARLWWAWVILAAIVVVGVIWIWFFVMPHPEGSYEDVQDVPTEQQLVDENGNIVDENGNIIAEGGEGASLTGIGSQGPNTLYTADNMAWTIDPQGLLAPVEIHGIGDNGVTIAFMPTDDGETVTVHFTSLEVDGQTYEVGAEDSPVHYNITAGPDGERDITSDPTFTVGKDDSGNLYGERVLISVDGLSEDAYNGLVLHVEETGPDGTATPGTISLSSGAIPTEGSE